MGFYDGIMTAANKMDSLDGNISGSDALYCIAC